MRTFLCTFLGVLVSTGPSVLAQSQNPCHNLIIAPTPATSGGFGETVVGVGDFDLDGWPDYAVAADTFQVAPGQFYGRVFVFSGRTSLEIVSFDGDQNSTRFGNSLADVGDVNGNGYRDLAVGAPDHDGLIGNGGKVFVFDGLTGAEIWSYEGPHLGGSLGWSLGVIDNTGDLVCGQPGYSEVVAGGGRLVFLDGATGTYEGAATFGTAFQGFGGTIATRVGSGRIFASSGNGAVYEVASPVGLIATFSLVHAADPTHNSYTELMLLESPGGGFRVVLGRQLADYNGISNSGRVDVYSVGGVTPDLTIGGTFVNERVGGRITAVQDFDGDGDEEIGYTSLVNPLEARARIVTQGGLEVEDVDGLTDHTDPFSSIGDVTGDGRGEWLHGDALQARAMLFGQGLTLTTSNTAGGAFTASFDIDVGAGNGGGVYVQVYGLSGSAPGFLGAPTWVHVPLNLDALTTLMLAQALKQSVMAPDAIGFLSGSGTATTNVFLPVAALEGQTLTTTVIVVPSVVDSTVVCATNPIEIEFP